MTFSGFTQTDFEVFKISGLDKRMDALQKHIQPKLMELGKYFSPTLSALTGDEMFAHVAKHARRTKNPPTDTWVAFSSNSRGYKMLPHFQIGLWESHVFIWYAVIYEAPLKQEIGQRLAENTEKIINEIPADFVWSSDHTKPDARTLSDMTPAELHSLFERLQHVKKSEILCGYHIPRETAIKMGPDELIHKADAVFTKLIPLYKLA